LYTARVRYIDKVGDTHVNKFTATFYHVSVIGIGTRPDEAILDLCMNLENKEIRLDNTRVNDVKYKNSQLNKIDYMLYKSGLA
jgi:hypothetical protein